MNVTLLDMGLSLSPETVHVMNLNSYIGGINSQSYIYIWGLEIINRIQYTRGSRGNGNTWKGDLNLNLYIGAWWYILENFLDKFLLVYSISTYHIFGILLSLSPVMGEQVAAHNGRELKSNMIGLVYEIPKINSFSLMFEYIFFSMTNSRK